MVFVCCATEDAAAGEAVRASLESNGLKCLLENPGSAPVQSSANRVSEAIRQAELFLLILSQQSNRSPDVRQQLETAAHFKLPVVTFRIESVQPADDLSFFLWEKHSVDGFEGPLDAHLAALLQQIKALLQSEEEERVPPLEAASSEQNHSTGSRQAESFANFRILRRPDGSLYRLGQGGMGVTYKAIDTTLDRSVALKLIAADLLKSGKARQRFLREAKAAAKIAHPNVATVFQFGEEGDAYFYAMEFIEGEDLERYVHNHGPLSPRDGLLVIHQVAQALEAAQSHQLIHRDIKPGNIMTRANRLGDLEVKLIDFGLARLADPSDSDAGQITHSQDFVGSPAFASPEQCEMHGMLDTRSDIYSLGVTLWYVLMAKLPFTGTVGQLLVAHAVKPPPWSELQSLPVAVVDLLRRMLAKDPIERPQTPAELQEAIEKVIAGLTGQPVTTRIGRSLSPGTAIQSGSELTFIPDRSAGSGQAHSGGSSPIHSPGEVVRPRQSESYSQVGVGVVLAERYRIITEIREGIGGRLYLAKDERATGRQPAAVAVKLLHPTIVSDFVLMNRVENEIGTIRGAADPHVLRYFNLEREVSAPFLVREWVHGFLLYDLLRWRRACRIAEVMKLLQPIAPTLDFIADHGLGLVDVSARKIFVCCPGDVDPATFSTIGQNSIKDWDRCEVKLNPLSLGPLIQHNRQLRGNQTLIPSSRILSLSQAETGIRGVKAVRLFARLIYELLSGHPSADTEGTKYTPLSGLNEAGNRVLQRACTSSSQAFKDCEDFWIALQESLEPVSGATRTPYPEPERVVTPIGRIPPIVPEIAVKTPPPAPSRPLVVEQPSVVPIAASSVEPPRLDRHPIQTATKEKPWENSLGMRFVPVARVFFCIWDTRLQDYEQFVQHSDYPASDKWKEPGFKQGPDHPVVNVSWDDAIAFCNWLTTREQGLGLLPARMSYRLPTDLDWSGAVGLGTEPGNTPEQKKGKIKVYPWGLGWPPPPGSGNYCGEETKGGRSSWPVIAGYNDGYARTSPVGAFPPNRYGLHDMGGNVWQWCEDWSNAGRYRRVLRGASWLNEHPDDLLLSHRRDDTPTSRRDNYGFRVVIA
jgi:serine/threonine protein kinase/formylglycine-generating enzyme required for sulfatase activity